MVVGGQRLTSCVMEGWRQQLALEGDEEAYVGCVFERVTMCDCDHGDGRRHQRFRWVCIQVVSLQEVC